MADFHFIFLLSPFVDVVVAMVLISCLLTMVVRIHVDAVYTVSWPLTELVMHRLASLSACAQATSVLEMNDQQINNGIVLWGYTFFAFRCFLPSHSFVCDFFLVFFLLIYFMAEGHAIWPYFHYFHFPFRLRIFCCCCWWWCRCSEHSVCRVASRSGRCPFSAFSTIINLITKNGTLCAARHTI